MDVPLLDTFYIMFQYACGDHNDDDVIVSDIYTHIYKYYYICFFVLLNCL